MNIHSFARGKIMKFLFIGGFCALLMFIVVSSVNTANGQAAVIVDIAKKLVGNNVVDVALAPVSVPINAAFIGIPFLLGMYGAMFVSIFSTILDWLFWLNTNVLPDQFGMIKTGFGICLSIANFMFVIALISIAFATILNVQEYNAKKMLGKVIVAAVAVNFSYLIIGFMLDLSHILTQYFITGGGMTSWSGVIGAILQPQKFLVTPTVANMITAIFSGPWWKMVMGAISGAMFTWIMALVVISIAMMFLARYVHLVFLIILMPLAWALPLFPNMGEMGKKWWSKFTEQLIFLPASTFFIYLSMKMAIKLQSVNPSSWADRIVPDSAGFSGQAISLTPQLVIQTLLPCAFLIASLIVAKSLGGSTASFGIKWGGKIASKLMGGVGKYAIRSPILGKGLAKSANFVNKLGGIYGIKVPKIPENKSIEQLAKGAVGGVGTALHKNIVTNKSGFIRDVARETGLTGLAFAGKEFGSSVDSYYKTYKEDYDHDELHGALHHLPETDEEKAGLLKLQVEKGEVKDFEDKDATAEKDKIMALANARIATNPKLADKDERAKDKELKALAAFRPDLSDDILGVDTSTFVHKTMDSREFQNISKHTLTPEFIKGLSASERASIARASREHEETITSGTTEELLVKLAGSTDDALNKLGTRLASLQATIATKNTEKKTNQDKLQSILATGSPTDIDNAKKALKKSADELIEQSRLRDEKLEEIKMNETAKKDPGIKNLINILERIEKNTGSIAARDKAEDKHGHKKEPELIKPFKIVSDVIGGGGGGGGGHSAGHH